MHCEKSSQLKHQNNCGGKYYNIISHEKTALGAAEAMPNKQTYLIWWGFLGGATVYGFEVISTLWYDDTID